MSSHTSRLPRITATGVLAISLLAIAACSSAAPTAQPAATEAASDESGQPAPTATAGTAVAPTVDLTPTPEPDSFVLNISSPVEAETVTTESSVVVAGQTRVDAVLSINDTFVEPDVDGRFSLVVELEEGPNVIEVVASISDAEVLSSVLTVISVPGA